MKVSINRKVQPPTATLPTKFIQNNLVFKKIPKLNKPLLHDIKNDGGSTSYVEITIKSIQYYVPPNTS